MKQRSCCLYRMWYKCGSSEGRKTVRQLHYLHVIPARLETHPRAFNPKFQTLDATLDLLNVQLSSGECVVSGKSLYDLAFVVYCVQAVVIIIIINVKIIVTLSQKMLQGHCTKRCVKICS